MPTLIDSLVVSLTLDPTQFTEGQRRAVDSLRDFEGRARRTAQSSQDSAGASAISFIRMIESPIAGLRRQFESIATQSHLPREALRGIADESRRTGEEVSRGMTSGALAFRAFGVAGVAAFAAYEGFNRILAATDRVAQGVFGAGLGALGAGTGVSGFSAIAQALNVVGNVPLSESQGVLSQMGETRARYERNPEALAQMQTAFAMAGVTNLPLFAPRTEHYGEDIISQLARDLQAMPAGNERGQRGWAIANLSDVVPRNMLNAMAQPGFLQQIDRERERSIQDDQLRAASGLIQAENNLSRAYDDLARKIATWAMPAQARGIGRVAALLDLITGNETPEDQQVLREWGHRLVNPGEIYRSGQQNIPSDTRNWWQRNAPIGWGGRPVPTATDANARNSDAASPGVGTGSDPRGMIPGLRAAAIAEGLNPDDVVALAGAEGLHEKKYATWDVNGMSYGAMQMHKGGLADEYQRATGRDPSNPVNEADMNSWAVHYIAMHGTNRKWTSVTNGRVREPRKLSAGPSIGSTSSILRPVQVDQARSGSITNNSGGNTSLSGVNITVHAPTREGSDIADAVHQQLQDAAIAANSQTGLQ